MATPLRHATFRRLFAAQAIALAGTGLATVALALLAYDLAGDDAGSVLGTALAIKMIAYVVLAPIASAWIPRAHRRRALIALDMVRAVVALSLPFVSEVWHVYVLVFMLQAASAGFTPVFQSLIPEVLPDERDYTRALSLSRLAYDLESLLSPMLATAVLALAPYRVLFGGTSAGFILSALLVWWTVFPAVHARAGAEAPFDRARRGMRIYLRTPRLRGLLALNLCAAAGGALVFVNTVVIVRGTLGAGDSEVGWALASFGAGSMLCALLLPRLLERVSDRRVLFAAAALMAATTTAAALWLMFGAASWTLVFALWPLFGIAYAGLVTPGGRLLRRSADAAHLPELFAAQFSLSHACWLVAYPLAGWLGAVDLAAAFAACAAIAIAAAILAAIAWRGRDEADLPHAHADLPPDHEHVAERPLDAQHRHRHPYRIDELHPAWPRPEQQRP